jgi:superfamily II DNA helicase RecQ
LLNQNGFSAASYHAGKEDEARAEIQKDFIQNRTRILCCTIAFSMGIDKSDIQSVIHYDLPRSIENYVQEIGRAGRDGKLARCHMFLNDADFYQLRRITLSDLLDNQSALRLTNVAILEAKK